MDLVPIFMYSSFSRALYWHLSLVVSLRDVKHLPLKLFKVIFVPDLHVTWLLESSPYVRVSWFLSNWML